MTVEKAIGYWKARYENTKYFDDVHCDADELREHEEYVEVLKETITALEKQLPKKIPAVNTPCHVKAFDSDTETVYTYSCVNCPVCSKWIVANVNHKYCQYCGQALDWGNKE